MGNNTGFTDGDGETSYTWDRVGNIKSVTGPAGTVSFTYDALYRTTEVTNEDGSTTGYTYDAVGNRTGITYPDGKTVTYTYDKLGNNTAITDHDGSTTRYSYDGEGRKKKEAHPDGSTTEFDYNNAGQLSQQKEVSKTNSTIREILYGYDDAGNLRSEERTGVGVDREDENLRYYYDGDNQLIRSVVEGKTTRYEYDAAGNMISDGENTYTYNIQNQLLTKSGKNGTTKYSYDAAGNLIKKVTPEGTTEYTWNSQGKLVRGENSDGSWSAYTYNAMGVRIENTQHRHNKNAGHANAEPDNGSSHIKNYLPALSDDRADWQSTWESEVGSVHQNDFETVTTHYTVDYLSEKNIDLMVDVDGAYTARYVYTRDELRVSAEITHTDGTERGKASKKGEYGENPASDFAADDISRVWYRTNVTGSNLYVVDEKGGTVSHVVYDIWGECLTETGIDVNFTGLEGISSFTNYAWDETLQLYFAQNRFYDPTLHRFIQSDITEDGSNWYVYTGNSPLLWTDPNGFRQVDTGGGGRASKGKTAVTTVVKKATGFASKTQTIIRPKTTTAAKAPVQKTAVTKTVSSISQGVTKAPTVAKQTAKTVAAAGMAQNIVAGAAAAVISANGIPSISANRIHDEAVRAAQEAAAIAKGKEYTKKAADRTAGLLYYVAQTNCKLAGLSGSGSSNNGLFGTSHSLVTTLFQQKKEIFNLPGWAKMEMTMQHDLNPISVGRNGTISINSTYNISLPSDSSVAFNIPIPFIDVSYEVRVDISSIGLYRQNHISEYAYKEDGLKIKFDTDEVAFLSGIVANPPFSSTSVQSEVSVDGRKAAKAVISIIEAVVGGPVGVGFGEIGKTVGGVPVIAR